MHRIQTRPSSYRGVSYRNDKASNPIHKQLMEHIWDADHSRHASATIRQGVTEGHYASGAHVFTDANSSHLYR